MFKVTGYQEENRQKSLGDISPLSEASGIVCVDPSRHLKNSQIHILICGLLYFTSLLLRLKTLTPVS